MEKKNKDIIGCFLMRGAQRIREIPSLADILFITPVLLIFFFWFYLRWPIWQDQAVFHYMAWGFSQGMIPYVDAINMNFPGIIVIHFIARMISASNPFGLRLLDTIFILILWLSTSAVLASWKVDWPIRLLVFCSYIIWYFKAGYPLCAQRESFAVPLVVLGITPWLIQQVRAKSFYYWAIFGAITGFGLWIKPTPVLIVFVALAFAFLKPDIVKPRLCDLFAYLSGITFTCFLFIGFLWIIGALGGFIKWGILYSLGPYRVSVSSWPDRFHETFKNLFLHVTRSPDYLSLFNPAYLSIVTLLLMTALRRKINMRYIYLSGSLAIFALLSALFQGRTSSGYHLIPLQWALAVFLAALVSEAVSIKVLAKFKIVVVIALVVVLAIAGNNFFHVEIPLFPGSMLGRALKNSLSDSETIVYFGFTPTVLFEFSKKTPFPFVDSWIMYCGSQGNRFFKDNIIGSLKESLKNPSVKYLVVQKQCLPFSWRGFKDTPAKIFENEIGVAWINGQGFFLCDDFKSLPLDNYNIYRRDAKR